MVLKNSVGPRKPLASLPEFVPAWDLIIFTFSIFLYLQTFNSSAPDKAHGVQYDRMINSFLRSIEGRHEQGDDRALAPGVTLSLG